MVSVPSLRAADYEVKIPSGLSGWKEEYDRLEQKLKDDLFAHHKISGPIAEMVWEKARQDYCAEAFGTAGLIDAFDSLMELVNAVFAAAAPISSEEP